MTRALPLRLGVIGPGIIWHKLHKPDVLARPDLFRVTAFAARSTETLDRARIDVPSAAACTSIEALLARADVDVVVVLTPIPLNAATALTARASGRPVLVEKPLGRTEAEAREVVDAVRNGGGTVCVLENAVYNNRDRLLRELVVGERCGRVVSFEKTHHAYFDPEHDASGYTRTEWRVHPQYPLGLMLDGGIHHLAAFHEAFGPPVALCASGSKQRREYGEYDTVTLLCEYGGGVHGTFSLSGCLPPGGNRYLVHGVEGMLDVEFRRVTLRPAKGEVVEFAVPAAPGMWVELADHLATGAPLRYTLDHALREARVLDAIAASLREGRRVVLDGDAAGPRAVGSVAP